jgi:acyl-[acyl carrier protein]--UDP-N-acetylglucosamine O-acyltransferase
LPYVKVALDVIPFFLQNSKAIFLDIARVNFLWQNRGTLHMERVPLLQQKLKAVFKYTASI